MKKYNLETLNDKEFELLVRDLYQKEKNILLESFKSGRDSGIDLRYATPKNQNKIIIQAKHWKNSSYSNLFSYLKNIELDKVRKINPNKYILCVSQSFTPKNKSDIFELFKPFIKSTSDIIDSETINNLLNKYPEVEKNHYKLWLSSIDIIQNILHASVVGRSNFYEEQIIRNIKKFVPTKTFNLAIEQLKDKKILILTGEPGIGKTLTAEMIVYDFLACNYQLVHVIDSIQEAESVFAPKGIKQIFYFDDFLGSNYFQIKNRVSKDSSILYFIDRVVNTKNKYMILTSRTTILSQAKQKSEKIKNYHFEPSEHEIELENYDEYARGQILYNHITLSKLEDPYINKFFENKNYWKIINHRNYNPRIVSFVTDSNNIETDTSNFLNVVINKFDNPDLIWEYSYRNQLDFYSQYFLETLYSFPSQVKEDILKEAYESRLEYEYIKNGLPIIPNIFYDKVHELLGGFITRSIEPHSGILYNFFNPSIADFLNHRFNSLPDLKWNIIESSKYLTQITSRFRIKERDRVRLTESEILRLSNFLVNNLNKLKVLNNGSLIFRIIYYFVSQLNSTRNIISVKALLKRVDFHDLSWGEVRNFLSISHKLSRRKELKVIIKDNWDKIIYQVIRNMSDIDDLYEMMELFSLFDMDYDEFLKDRDNYQWVVDYVEETLQFYYENQIENRLSEITEYYEAERIAEEIEDEMRSVLADINIDSSDINVPNHTNDYQYLHEIVDSNRDNASSYFFNPRYRSEKFKTKNTKVEKSTHQLVDELFQR